MTKVKIHGIREQVLKDYTFADFAPGDWFHIGDGRLLIKTDNNWEAFDFVGHVKSSFSHHFPVSPIFDVKVILL